MADTTTTALQAAIALWAAQLQADAASPQPTYTIDGKNVQRNEWRENLQKLIADAQNTINQRNPTIVWNNPLGNWPGCGW